MGILLWPNGTAAVPKHMTSDHTIEDLQLEALCEAMSFNHYYKLTVRELAKLWTDDPEILRYRQDILRDLLAYPSLASALEELLDSIETWESHSGRSARSSIGSGGGASMDPGQTLDLWSFSFLESYLQKLETLESCLGNLQLSSTGMQAFRDRIRRLRESGRVKKVGDYFHENCTGYALPSRISIGFNLNDSLKPVNLKLLAIPNKNERTKNGTAIRSKGRRLSMTPNAMRTCSQVLGKAVGDAGQSISGFVRQESSELRAVRQDIIFWLSVLKLRQSWISRGMQSCIPVIRPAEECAFRTKTMFNPLLVVHKSEQIVANDITFASGGELLVLTGANQGGKTVFLLSVALTQWLSQLGIMVPCEAAELSPVEQVLTVFAPNASTTSAVRTKGLLAEEAGRIADAVKTVSPGCMVLFNEPLNATSPMENLYISREVMGAFKAAGARGIWVTHLYELASDRERVNSLISWGSRIGSIRIVVKTDETGTHSTYHIERGEPEFNSYAAEVMRRKGLNLTT